LTFFETGESLLFSASNEDSFFFAGEIFLALVFFSGELLILSSFFLDNLVFFVFLFYDFSLAAAATVNY